MNPQLPQPRTRNSILLLLICLFSLPTIAAAQAGTIEGRVSAADTTSFLEGATVTLAGTSFRSETDRSGRFTISNVPSGDYTAVVRYVGFQTVSKAVTITSGVSRLDIEMTSTDEIYDLGEFIVSNEASGSERALSRQLAAANNVDIIASDNFGLLPDSTVADAVRRLAGINVEQSQGRAGRYVTIRGMNADFNAVSVNGQKVIVSNFDGASRSVPLDVVPANNAESIQVTKTALPSTPADAIGGTIDIRSRSAFDRTSAQASIEGAIGHLSLAGDYFGSYPQDTTPLRFSVSWADKINPDETIGLALSANFSDRPFLFRSVENGPYEIDQGDYFPSYGRLEEAFDNVESTGLTGRLDWRPSERFELVLDINYTQRETNQGSHRATTNFDPGFLVGDLEFSGDTAIAFTSEDRTEREIRDYYEEQENLNITAKLTHRFGDWTLDYGAGINQGDFAGDPQRDLRAFFRTEFRDPDGNFYENSYLLPGGSGYNPQFGSNVSARPLDEFSLFEVRGDTRIIEDTNINGFINLKRDVLWGDIPGSIKVGLSYQDSDRDFDDLRRRYTLEDTDTDWTLASVIINGNEQIYGSVVADYGIERGLNGQPFGPMIDPVKVREAEAALIAAGIRDEGDPNWYLNQNTGRDARADLINSYDLTEEVFGSYLEARFQMQKLSIITGARIETTDVRVDTHAGDFFVSNPSDPLFVRPITGTNDYTNVLPHLHLRYDLNDDVIIRASINQTLARPSYRQLNPSIDIDEVGSERRFINEDGDIDFEDQPLIIKGRTDLDPTLSTNYDLSVDYFFGRNNRFSVGVFYKDMKDNIYRLERNVLPEDPDYFGEFAEVREFLNADGAQVFGIEVSIDYDLATLSEWLFGFSITANYTYTDSEVDGIQRQNPDDPEFGVPVFESGRTPLFGQVPHTANVALHFARWNFESRLALNWSDDYLDFNGINADPLLDDYNKARTRVDFSLRYRFENNVSLFLEVQNLFDDDSRAYSGNRDTRMFYREESGRFAMLGLSWSL